MKAAPSAMKYSLSFLREYVDIAAYTSHAIAGDVGSENNDRTTNPYHRGIVFPIPLGQTAPCGPLYLCCMGVGPDAGSQRQIGFASRLGVVPDRGP